MLAVNFKTWVADTLKDLEDHVHLHTALGYPTPATTPSPPPRSDKLAPDTRNNPDELM